MPRADRRPGEAGWREQVEAALGYRFADSALLERALTHSSRAHEDRDGTRGNERLEFLGDAVLDLVISELLMEARRDADEGTLSRARAGVVNQGALAEHARQLGLGRWLRLGRGEDRSGGRTKASILANVFEAVLGALYLDGGLDAARPFVAARFGPVLDEPRTWLHDAKTQLQELLQQRGDPLPEYVLLDASGPDHDREFQIEVRVEARGLGTGLGRSKREAEQEAARAALRELES